MSKAGGSRKKRGSSRVRGERRSKVEKNVLLLPEDVREGFPHPPPPPTSYPPPLPTPSPLPIHSSHPYTPPAHPAPPPPPTHSLSATHSPPPPHSPPPVSHHLHKWGIDVSKMEQRICSVSENVEVGSISEDHYPSTQHSPPHPNTNFPSPPHSSGSSSPPPPPPPPPPHARSPSSATPAINPLSPPHPPAHYHPAATYPSSAIHHPSPLPAHSPSPLPPHSPSPPPVHSPTDIYSHYPPTHSPLPPPALCPSPPTPKSSSWWGIPHDHGENVADHHPLRNSLPPPPVLNSPPPPPPRSPSRSPSRSSHSPSRSSRATTRKKKSASSFHPWGTGKMEQNVQMMEGTSEGYHPVGHSPFLANSPPPPPHPPTHSPPPPPHPPTHSPPPPHLTPTYSPSPHLPPTHSPPPPPHPPRSHSTATCSHHPPTYPDHPHSTHSSFSVMMEEEPDDGVPRVLVTGASGYIALHVTKRLLEDGRFRVRGSVRNKSNAKKVHPLLDLVPDAKYPLRLVEADLTEPESWKRAVRSCTYVFHLASPFPSPDKPQSDRPQPQPQPQPDKALTDVAVEGTLSVLRACVGEGTVKRVVLTSSIAAILCGRSASPGKPADYLYSESDWSDEALCTPYERSKLRAERTAWEFMRNKDKKTFDLVVLNPGYVQGPFLGLAAGDTSKTLCTAILSNQVPGYPNIVFPLVDVRDVATAHIAALDNPRAGGNRYALVSETVGMREVAMIIAKEFNLQGYQTPTIPVHKTLVYVPGFFDSAAYYPCSGKVVHFNNEKMRNELGITPYSVKDTIIDTCYSLVDLGAVKRTPGYLGHPSARSLLPATSSFPPPTAKPPADGREGQVRTKVHRRVQCGGRGTSEYRSVCICLANLFKCMRPAQ